MRIFFLLCCSLVFALGPKDASAQNAEIVINSDKTLNIKQVFKLINKQTGYRFIYRNDLINDIPGINFKKGKIKTHELLDIFFTPVNVGYTFTNDSTIIVRKNLSNSPISNKISKKVIQQTVKGVIRDTNGNLLPGASIVEKGTTNGVISDFNGNYSISVPEDATLVISFIGYATQEVAVNGRSEIDIVLEFQTATLGEVVVVGYGTQKKKDVIGAVASANIENFKNAPNTNIGQILQGTVPGLNIGQVNKAGQTPKISIRGKTTISGNSDVLIIVDGIQYNSSLSALNPDDIASIDVLKDASSTAIYGAQAANGVILISTKKGKRNQKPRIFFSNSYTVQTPTTDLRPMNRQEYLEHIRYLFYDEAFLAPDYTVPNSDFDVASKVDVSMLDSDGNILKNDYDWWDAATHPGSISEVNVSVSGGTERISYLFSLGYTDQEGFIKNDNFQRRSIRVNLESQATDWLTVGIQSFGSFVKTDGSEPSLEGIIYMSPLLVPFDENGDLIPNPFNTIEANPFLTYYVDDYDRENYFFGNLYSEIDFPFLKGLKYRINFGNNYKVSNHYWASEYGARLSGSAYKRHNDYYDYTLDNILTYENTFKKHNIKATLLYGAVERKNNYTSASAKGFTRMNLGYHNLQLGELQYAKSSAWSESLLYQMARINYKYDDKYLITGTIRRDGFSGFAENHKYGIFPSLALGWTVSKEPFFDHVKWIQNLKIRAGYGVSGNQTERYSSLAKLESDPAYVFGDGGSTVIGQEMESLANPNLRWEKTSGLNLGIDFSFFNSRLTGNVDYYKDITDDLLFSVAIPYITGFKKITTNVGKLENKGIEFSLTSVNINTDHFRWSSTLNFSSNSNKIVELTGMDKDGDGKEDDLVASRLFIGQPLGAIYNYEPDGIYQLGDDIPDGFYPGTYRIVDQDGNGTIDPDDRVILGHAEPAFRMSLWNEFSYKNFSLGVFLNSIQGGKDGFLGNNTNRMVRTDNTIRKNYLNGVNYWSPTNPDGDQPWSIINPKVRPSLYKDRSFIRLQDVVFSYDFGKLLLSKTKIQNLSLFFSGKNLAIWTKWKGWDPETGQGMILKKGRPVLKSYSLGFNLIF